MRGGAKLYTPLLGGGKNKDRNRHQDVDYKNNKNIHVKRRGYSTNLNKNDIK